MSKLRIKIELCVGEACSVEHHHGTLCRKSLPQLSESLGDAAVTYILQSCSRFLTSSVDLQEKKSIKGPRSFSRGRSIPPKARGECRRGHSTLSQGMRRRSLISGKVNPSSIR